jgi:hypothetical protein
MPATNKAAIEIRRSASGRDIAFPGKSGVSVSDIASPNAS